MPVAALTALYPTSTSHAGRPRAPYQCLDNSKIKKLVIVFRNYPSDPANADEYWRTIKHTIQDLPTSLRSLIVLATSTDASGKLKPGKLCTHHNGLRADLIYSIWAWVKHELDSGIGIFLYPILVKAGLPMLQEWKVRQLEPVQRMWRRDFDALEQTPEGRQPIISDKWSYQENQCPACMLARIGSDTQVLSALYAGMVGRYSSKKVGKKDKSRSNRVNFIRYLLKQSDSGEKLVDESWDLGKEMKRVREGWREHQRDSVRVNFYGRKSRSSISSSSQPRDSCILINTSELFDLNDNVKSFADPQDSSFVACSANTGCTESGIGVDISDLYVPPANPYMYPTNPTPGPAPASLYADRASSIYSQSTNGCRNRTYSSLPPIPNLFYQPLQSFIGPEPLRITSFRDHSKVHFQHHLSIRSQRAEPEEYNDVSEDEGLEQQHFLNMPHAHRNSMYSGFGTAAHDSSVYGASNRRAKNKYGDVSSPESPKPGTENRDAVRLRNMVRQGLYDGASSRTPSRATSTSGVTRWSELYN